MIQETFPIDASLGEIGEAVRRGASVLVKAEPGAGKTTRLPPRLMEILEGRVLVLEPRRLAARLAAERVAEERGETLGERIGYQVRYDAKVSERSELVFVTEGLFLRILRENPTLDGISAVVLDEFHERNIQTDLALALVTRLMRGDRADLKLVVMSATLETRALERYLDDPAVFEVPGRQHPVTVEYRPPPPKAKADAALAPAVREMLSDSRCPGNILIFQTGVGEIFANADRLRRELKGVPVEIIPLAADLPRKEQQRAFAQASDRKIVLATNVAETSLTIPGVTGVIDPGFAKIPGHAPWSGMPTLEVKKISQASCIQRAGRAGREKPGLVFRLFSDAEFRARDPFTPPDITRLDFTGTLLDVLALTIADSSGAGRDVATLIPWFEFPEEKNVASAYRTLQYLRAVDREGALTERGRNMARLPLHPRPAAVAWAGVDEGIPGDALAAACLISEGFAISGGRVAVEKGLCDVSFQLDLLKTVWRKDPLPSQAVEKSLDRRTVQRVAKLYGALARSVGAPGKPSRDETNAKALSVALLAGYPDRVAKKRDIRRKKKPAKKKKGPPLYNFCLGRGGMIGEESVLDAPEFVVALEAMEKLSARDASKGTMIRTGSTVTADVLKRDPGGLTREEVTTEFDEEQDRLQAFATRYYGNLVVESRKTESSEDPEEYLVGILRKTWPQPFSLEELERYHARVRLISEAGFDDNLPRLEGEMLEVFLHAICEGASGVEDLSQKTLIQHVSDHLSYEQAECLRQLPDKMELPNGRRVEVHYPAEGPPQLSGLIQDFYGLDKTPRLLEGRVVPVVKLCAPNGRPAQVTSDLAGFWTGSYASLRRQLERRYPKHHWADRPDKALAVPLKKHLRQ